MIRSPAKRRVNVFVATLVAALLVPAIGSAAPTTKQARSGDVASRYILQDNGNLFRVVGNQKCQVTSNVADFKISQHAEDVAMIYFVRQERGSDNLYVLHNADDEGQCPKANRVKILDNVAKERGKYKYHVVSSTRTKVVALALAQTGRFVAWDNEDVVVSRRGVRDYRLHNNFGVKGASFRRYAAFAIDRRGRVFKVDGNRPDRSSLDERRRYADLNEFWSANLSN